MLQNIPELSYEATKYQYDPGVDYTPELPLQNIPGVEYTPQELLQSVLGNIYEPSGVFYRSLTTNIHNWSQN